MNIKKYDYDSVINFCSRNRELCNALEELEYDLKTLRQNINELEQLFHGTANKTFYNFYDKLYHNIGTPSYGLWNMAYTCKEIIDAMYTNAINDKERDEEMMRSQNAEY